jgi:hypothetical protein
MSRENLGRRDGGTVMTSRKDIDGKGTENVVTLAAKVRTTEQGAKPGC